MAMLKELFDLGDRVALITGGARGIGLESARLLAEAGAAVALVDRDGEALGEAVADLQAGGARCLAVTADIAEPGRLSAVVEDVSDWAGAPDILVNNAALVQRVPATELRPDLWRQAMAVNLDAAFELSRLVQPGMVAKGGGAIVNIASIMALSGGGFYPIASYHASKGAMVNLTRGLAMEWGPLGIRVNAVAPTWIRTDFNRAFLDQPGVSEPLLASMPLGRFAALRDAAAAVLYLCAPAAAMVTGHVLPVDGGYLAH
ncbi:SDR family oxidoreductase [Stappia sp. WLB 29]|uniref:SDR family NAD(P)-dependent oxidoreductase n=1 Tax=Stappia sp. WLB 29 TaxID=2925220 RepID=UPI0020C1548D|nr:SDR family oxidoreductase [Stappia sp. WLB 29]